MNTENFKDTRVESENNSDDNENENKEDDDDKDEEEATQPQLRRSTRVSTKPLYLEEYVLLAKAKSERPLMVINN